MYTLTREEIQALAAKVAARWFTIGMCIGAAAGAVFGVVGFFVGMYHGH